MAYHSLWMAEPRDLGQLRDIAAEAVGEPGRRRFRLTALGETGEFALMWLEKEQLAGLGEAIGTVLAGEGYRHAPVPLDDTRPRAEYPVTPDHEFQIAQLSMGVDPRRGRMVITAAGPEDAGGPSVSMTIDFHRSHELREQISAVVAAGRPPCPLCGGPIDPGGHVCPRRNGHHEPA